MINEARIRQEFSDLENPPEFQVDLNTLTISSEGFTLTCLDAEEWLFRVEFNGTSSEDHLLCSEGGEWEIWLDDYRVKILCFSLLGALNTLLGLYHWRIK